MSQSNKKIILHIGGHKTGSTSLQSYLAQNSEKLIGQGIYYPLIEDSRFHMNTGRNKIINGFILQSQYYLPEILEGILEKFDSDETLETLILSEENLFFADHELHKLHPDAEIKLKQYNTYILVCLRRSVEYICGKWQEEIRFNSLRSLEEILNNNHYQHSLEQLFHYGDMFGGSKILVETYNVENLDSYDVIPQMLSALGVQITQSTYVPPSRKNLSVSRSSLDARRFISNYTKVYLNKSHIEKYDFILQYGPEQSALNSLDDQQIKQVCDRYYALECKVAKTFLDKEMLFESPYPSIYGTARKIESNKISSFKRALLRCVVKDIILTTHYQNPNLIQKLIVYLWVSIPFKWMRGLNHIYKKLNNRLHAKIDHDAEWLFKILQRIFRPYDE